MKKTDRRTRAVDEDEFSFGVRGNKDYAQIRLNVLYWKAQRLEALWLQNLCERQIRKGTKRLETILRRAAKKVGKI